MDGRAGAEQDRADGLGIAQAGQQFVGDVGRFERRENQHVGILDLAEGVALLDDLCNDGSIRLHFAVHHQVGALFSDQFDRLAHFGRKRVFG